MVDLGSSEQPGPRYRTTAVLQPGEDSAIVVRVRPQFPGDDAARMPGCALIWGAGAFPLSVPAKPEDWLAADDTLTSAGGARLPERQRRSSVAGPQIPAGRAAIAIRQACHYGKQGLQRGVRHAADERASSHRRQPGMSGVSSATAGRVSGPPPAGHPHRQLSIWPALRDSITLSGLRAPQGAGSSRRLDRLCSKALPMLHPPELAPIFPARACRRRGASRVRRAPSRPAFSAGQPRAGS